MNIQKNVTFMEELRQIHRQLIRTDVDQMYSLLEMAMLRENVARQNYIGEFYSFKRNNELELDIANSMELGDAKSCRGELSLPENFNLNGTLKEEIMIDEKEDVDDHDQNLDEANGSIEYSNNSPADDSPLLNDLESYNSPKIDLKEWRRLYEDELGKKYIKHTRVRYLFCRELYACYLEKLRQINRTPEELLTVNEKRFIKKFDLEGDTLLDRITQKPYVCYEDLFEIIHNSHIKLESDGGPRDIFNSLKDNYANVTLLSVQIYWKIRYKLLKEQCYMQSKEFISNLEQHQH